MANWNLNDSLAEVNLVFVVSIGFSPDFADTPKKPDYGKTIDQDDLNKQFIVRVKTECPMSVPRKQKRPSRFD